MGITFSILLALGAFWLGACPFSVWISKKLAKKDIREYGDGNPGAFNVFRSSGTKMGILALILDIAKGAPFVALSHAVCRLPLPVVLVIGLCAILGHAYSPFLNLKGGKALAVTLGVLLALPQHDIAIAMLILTLLGFLLMESHAWAVMFGPPVTLVYLLVTRGPSWEALFIVCVLAIWIAKQFDELRTVPRLKMKPVAWFRSWRAAHDGRQEE